MSDDTALTAMAIGLCDWFEETQDSHLADTLGPCEFHLQEARAALTAIRKHDRDNRVVPGYVEPVYVHGFGFDVVASDGRTITDTVEQLYRVSLQDPKS